MNSIVSPTRTETVAQPARLHEMATALATVLFVVLLISLRPFQPAASAGADGDLVNQLGFGTIGILSLGALLSLVDRRLLAMLLDPVWIVLAAFVVLSVFTAGDPSAAMRVALFTFFAILAILAVLCLALGSHSLPTVVSITGLLVLVVSYGGILLLPGIAIHGLNSQEVQHAGLWRGSFPHKNVAGPVMACLIFMAIYWWRCGGRKGAVLLFAGALVFVVNSGSKTTALLVPVAILMVLLPGLFGWRRFTVLLCLLTVVSIALATIGSVLFPPVDDLLQSVAPGMTYTGRTALWAYGAEMIALRPLTGYGLESFWGTPLVVLSEQPFDRDWDIRTIVHGHNGFMDMALMLGIPAMLWGIVAFVFIPLRDFLHARRVRENVLAADLFLMMWLFLTVNAMLESFFFRRADPVWLLFVFAIFGLRLCARFTMGKFDVTA